MIYKEEGSIVRFTIDCFPNNTDIYVVCESQYVRFMRLKEAFRVIILSKNFKGLKFRHLEWLKSTMKSNPS